MTTSRTGNNLRPINSSNDSRNKVSHKEVRSNKWNDLTKTGAPGHRITIDPAHQVIVEQVDPVEEAVAAVVEGDNLLTDKSISLSL